jgi:Phospholipase_D-nuclease N-terminal
VLWFFLLSRITIDILRSQDLGGWDKSLWLIFAIVLPFLGVLIYLVARGGSMAQRDVRQAQEADAATRRHIQSAAGTSTSTTSELTKLVGLRDLWGSNIRPMTLLAQAACRYSLMRPPRIGCRTMRRACLRDWGVRVAVGAAARPRWGRCDRVEVA